MIKNLVCPISEERVNERVSRITALLTILLVIAGLIFSSVIIFVFLLADFFIRAFTPLKYSPLSYLGSSLAHALNLSKKPIDKAPKIFAARLGFIMTLAITILSLFNFSVATMVISGVLVFFALLEFTLGICVGCIIYTYVVLPFYK